MEVQHDSAMGEAHGTGVMTTKTVVMGGSAISPTGFSHLVAQVDDSGSFATACGLEVAPWSGWGPPNLRLEAYRQCSNCSIHGPIQGRDRPHGVNGKFL